MYITHEQTLVWHDCPILFLGKNSDREFLCMAIPDTWGFKDPYLCVEVKSEVLENLLDSKLDLLDIFTYPFNSKWYAGEFKNKLKVKVVATKFKEIPKNCLPSKGFLI